MQRFLERWESGIRQLIPLAYLAGLLAGTVAVFSGFTIGGRVATGILVGIAIELHTFFLERQTRADYALWRAEQTKAAGGRLKASIYPLAVMLVLQGACSVVFTAETYHPTGTALPLPVMVVAIGLITPGLAFLAGFLIPLQRSPTEMLAEASHTMLGDTMTSVQKQWYSRVRSARKGGHNLAPVAQALLEDAGHGDHARRLSLMDAAIPGGTSPRPPAPKPTRTTKTRRPRPPTRRKSDIDELRDRRYATLRTKLADEPNLTLSQAQKLLGMRNRQGVQNIWQDVRQELGIGVRQQQAG